MKCRQETYIIWNWKDIGRPTFNMCILKYRYLIQKTTYWKTNSKRYILNKNQTLFGFTAEMAAAMF